MALEARLPESERHLVTELLLADASEPPTLEQGRAALEALQALARQGRLKARHKQIQEAQKAGKLEEALRLLESKQELERNK